MTRYSTLPSGWRAPLRRPPRDLLLSGIPETSGKCFFGGEKAWCFKRLADDAGRFRKNCRSDLARIASLATLARIGQKARRIELSGQSWRAGNFFERGNASVSRDQV